MTPESAAPVMYLTHRAPYPPDKGDRIRNYHLLRHLAGRGPVWLGCLADEPVPPDTVKALAALTERLEIVPSDGFGRWLQAGLSLAQGQSLSEGLFANAGLRQTIRAWTSQTRFKAAVASASSLAPYLRRDGLEQTPAIVDLVDVDSQKWSDFAANAPAPRRWIYALEAKRVRKLEGKIAGWARAAAVVSRAEADVFDAIAGRAAATVATNGVDLEYFCPADHPTESACVFVGAMDYLPNVDGAVWFAHEVWPAVRSRMPGAEFRIVGRSPSRAVQALGTLPGVVVTGSVPDVRPFVTGASVVVAPLRLGRGVQNKVLEALAMGKAVVAAPAALAALQTIPGTHLLKASAASEWVDAVSRLMADPARCRELGAEGRRYVEMHHQWDRCLEPLLQKIFGEPSETRETGLKTEVRPTQNPTPNL